MSLKLDHLSVSYGHEPLVSQLTAHAKSGQFIGLIGPNGAGKTCVLKTIAGLLKPHRGNVSVTGRDVHTLPAKQRARHIAYLAQNRPMAWSLSVRELVALGRAPFHSSLSHFSADDEIAIDTALRTAHCYDLQNRKFDKLSGGEQMRVHLARALAVNAPLLLADEPTTALDPYFQISILEALRTFALNGKTVIASLHDLTLAKQFCTRIWVLHEGKLILDEAPETAFNPDMLARVFDIRSTDHGWEIL